MRKEEGRSAARAWRSGIAQARSSRLHACTRAGGNPDSNTLISEMTTVICLDDFHSLDRQGRSREKVTALDPKAQDFKLMKEQVRACGPGVRRAPVAGDRQGGQQMGGAAADLVVRGARHPRASSGWSWVSARTHAPP